MTWPTVCLRGAAVTYSTGDTSFDAIQGIDLDIPPATSHCLVGRSGSGKSTLVSVMALLRRPTRGKMWVNGIDTSTLGDAALSRLRGRFVGTVFQSFHLEAGFTARENTMLAWYFGSELSRRQARARADYLLGVVGIPELVDRPAGQMSGGQRQRVGIARALFSNPRILIADEPTGNLDERTAGAVSDVIFTLPRQLGTAVVVVTHDPMVARRAMVTHRLQQGRLTGSHLQRQV